MEIADVRKRLLHMIERAKRQAAERRARTDEASRAFDTFLETIAVPLFRQVANSLRADGYLFNVFTPSGSVRLMSDRGAEDFIEVTLDSSSIHSCRRTATANIVEISACLSPAEKYLRLAKARTAGNGCPTWAQAADSERKTRWKRGPVNCTPIRRSPGCCESATCTTRPLVAKSFSMRREA